LATSPCQPTISLQRLVNPTERQREFLQAIADHDFVLYGGEAGGGKSYILRWWLVLFLVWCFRVLGLREVSVGLFCEDYPTLNDRQISKIKFEFPTWLGTLRESGVREFVLRSEYGGGILKLRNLDDPSKYYSAEFAAIAVDELTRNPLSVFNDLRFRLRWPGIERPKFGAGTNPGGPGHAWVKKYWIPGSQSFPPELEPIKDQFILVRAKASDNPHLPVGYHDRLLTLPPDMARMVARGDWEVYTGQFFPQFESVPGRHVLRHVEALQLIRPWHSKWLSGDWGYEHPFSIYKHAQSEDGVVVTYGELCDRRVSETELGHRITEFCRGEKMNAFAFSWDAGKLSSRSQPLLPKSMMQLVADALGPGIPKPYPADSSPGSRISGARLMSQMLDVDLWKISDACPRLITCLPTLIRNEDNPEDVLKTDFAINEIGDDPYDGARMGLQHMALAHSKPWSVSHQEAVTKAIGDPENPNYNAAFMKDMEMREQQQKQRAAQNTRSKSLQGRRRFL